MRSDQIRYLVLTATSATALTLVLGGCAPAEQTSTGTTTTTSPTVPTLPAFTTTTTTSQAAEPADFAGLLLTPEDVSDHEDTFVERSSTPDADGQPGASAFFVNVEDTRAITDTIVVYPSPEEATAALQMVVADPARVVSGGDPQPVPVGTDGTIIRGTSPIGDKDVTLLLFTQDRALVRLKFESATGDATTDPYVIAIGKMQQIALRNGLADSE